MRLLTVFAHPDDESFGPGGALARVAGDGHDLVGLWLTRGEGGDMGIDDPLAPDALARARSEALHEAARIIGYRAVDLRDYPDGGLPDLGQETLTAIVAEAIVDVLPDVVLTFGPTGISRHPDHIALSAATTAAFHAVRARHGHPDGLFYTAATPRAAKERGLEHEPDGNPNTFIEVGPSFERHKQALACHARLVADARDMLATLEREPRLVAPFFRAWPPVAPGERITTFDVTEGRGAAVD